MRGEGLGEKKFAIGAIENVEKAVAIGLEEEFAGVAIEIRVEEHGNFSGVPIVKIEGRELEMPLEFSSVGVESEDAIGVEVIAFAAGAVVGG